MPKEIPGRMCIGCREVKPKNELVRVIRTPEGSICLDLTGKGNGRGAYLCGSRECFKKAQKQRALSRALKCEVPESIYEELERKIENEQ